MAHETTGAIETRIGDFVLAGAEDGTLTGIRNAHDPAAMNWVRPEGGWGAVEAPGSLSVRRSTLPGADGEVSQRIELRNDTQFPVLTAVGEIAVAVPFHDAYDSGSTCMTDRCHAHVWCGGTTTYVMGLRMGGAAPHLGLVLDEGSIVHYSIERDTERSSNDRGTIRLLSAPVALEPGESTTIGWRLFWHAGRDDFATRALGTESFLRVEADRYVLELGDPLHVDLAGGPAHAAWDLVPAGVEGASVETVGDRATVRGLPLGHHRIDVTRGGERTHLAVWVRPALRDLVAARCRFIVEHQAYHRPGSSLDGALLVYDNEDDHPYYSHVNDHNAARERVGMGVLLAKALRGGIDVPGAAEALAAYWRFLTREVVDVESGVVANDVRHNHDMHRLYNYPWIVTLGLEMYDLYGDQDHLLVAARVARAYYRGGGHSFYPIELPMHRLVVALREAGRIDEAESLTEDLAEHCRRIMAVGTDYPPSEVNYEQTIVAPAALILLEMFHVSGEERYLAEAERHLEILRLFNGPQPDHRLNEVAIRHWDGFWFGKRRLLGDTFPHYWSGLSGRAFASHARATGREESTRIAHRSISGVLSMFTPDGRATCAELYPFSVNGEPGGYRDPWANDQDWGLYFAVDELVG